MLREAAARPRCCRPPRACCCATWCSRACRPRSSDSRSRDQVESLSRCRWVVGAGLSGLCRSRCSRRAAAPTAERAVAARRAADRPAQGMAVLPGVSRSALTIATALALGLSPWPRFASRSCSRCPPWRARRCSSSRPRVLAQFNRLAWPAAALAFVSGCVGAAALRGLLARGRFWLFSLYLVPLGAAMLRWDVLGGRAMGQRFAVIMAGGSGTRFWPRRAPPGPSSSSRSGGCATRRCCRPRCGARSALVGPEHVLVVTSARHAGATARAAARAAARERAARAGRPQHRAVRGLGRAQCGARDPDARDRGAAGRPPHRRRGRLPRSARARASRRPRPARSSRSASSRRAPRPATATSSSARSWRAGVHRVRALRREARRASARGSSSPRGRFLWNSGMFFFRADVLLARVRNAPARPGRRSSRATTKRPQARRRSRARARSATPRCPSISIDHGVMEKAARHRGRARRLRLVRRRQLDQRLGARRQGRRRQRAARRDVLAIDTRGCLRARAATASWWRWSALEDLVVVDTEDALLVMPRERAQDVRAGRRRAQGAARRNAVTCEELHDESARSFASTTSAASPTAT